MVRPFLMIAPLLFLAFESHADNFVTATQVHAQSAAHDLGIEMTDARRKGTSWRTILSKNLPNKIDDRCGYQDLINLSDEGFEAKKSDVSQVVGGRLDKAFRGVLSRPGSALDLVQVRNLTRTAGEQVLVQLKVIPARKDDIRISFLYQLNGDGGMSLCDILTGDTAETGVLYQLGKELNL